MRPFLSTRNSDHVMHAQKKVAQKWKNQINHLVANRTSQLVTNQLVINHQQENARTSQPCLVKILFSPQLAQKMKMVKWLVMFNALTVNSSWEKRTRPVLQSCANARDQNASGPIAKRRLSTVK